MKICWYNHKSNVNNSLFSTSSWTFTILLNEINLYLLHWFNSIKEQMLMKMFKIEYIPNVSFYIDLTQLKCKC